MTTAKPAGEPRPLRWTIKSYVAGGHDVFDGDWVTARCTTRLDAERVAHALNAAETRAAQPNVERLVVAGEALANRLSVVPTFPEDRAALAEWREATMGADTGRPKSVTPADNSGSAQNPAAQPGDAPKLTGSQTSADFLATCKANGITMVAMSVEEFQRRFNAALLAAKPSSALAAPEDDDEWPEGYWGPRAPAPASTEALIAAGGAMAEELDGCFSREKRAKVATWRAAVAALHPASEGRK